MFQLALGRMGQLKQLNQIGETRKAELDAQRVSGVIQLEPIAKPHGEFVFISRVKDFEVADGGLNFPILFVARFHRRYEKIMTLFPQKFQEISA